MTEATGSPAIGRFFEPDGVALFGLVMPTTYPKQLREPSRWGERLYFVNPSGGSVGEVPIYRPLAELPESA